MPQIVIRTPRLDRAVRTYETFDMPSRKPGKNSLTDVFDGGGGQLSHQFKVIDDSNDNGMRITVINGQNPSSSYAGKLNGVSYARTTIALDSGIGTFHVYAIAGQIYALRHTFASDVMPVLLLATVSVSDGTLSITQENVTNNPSVPVLPAEYGPTVIGYTLNYASHILACSYTAAASLLRNNVPLTMAATSIPASSDGGLYAYVEELNVANNQTPSAGIAFAGSVPSGAEWTRKLLGYSMTDTAEAKSFHITARADTPYIFTFTTVPLNAAEAGK